MVKIDKIDIVWKKWLFVISNSIEYILFYMLFEINFIEDWNVFKIVWSALSLSNG